jgi:hypothetical protein
LAASQNGFVHSFGTGIGLVTLLQSLIRFLPCAPCSLKLGRGLINAQLFIVREFVAHDPGLPGLNHVAVANFNAASAPTACPLPAKAENICSIRALPGLTGCASGARDA